MPLCSRQVLGKSKRNIGALCIYGWLNLSEGRSDKQTSQARCVSLPVWCSLLYRCN